MDTRMEEWMREARDKGEKVRMRGKRKRRMGGVEAWKEEEWKKALRTKRDEQDEGWRDGKVMKNEGGIEGGMITENYVEEERGESGEEGMDGWMVYRQN